MEFNCSNLRLKKTTLVNTDGRVTANGDVLDVSHIYYRECTGTYEYVELVIELNKLWNKKDVLFLNASWLRKSKKKCSDGECIAQLNEAASKIYSGIPATELKNYFEGKIQGTFQLSHIFDVNGKIIAPAVSIIKDVSSQKTLFLERMASYQRNFDIALCLDDAVFLISSINRKQYAKYVSSLGFEHFTRYIGGADPINWTSAIKIKKKEKLTWENISERYSVVDEINDSDDSDWVQQTSDGSSDESSDGNESSDYNSVIIESDPETIEIDYEDEDSYYSETEDSYCSETEDSFDEDSNKRTLEFEDSVPNKKLKK
jgi:hypothetical protein